MDANKHITKFLNFLQYEKRYSAHTSKSYKLDLTQFEEFIQRQYEITDITTAKHLHVRSWIVALMEAEMTTKSINRKISTLRSFFNFLKKKKEIETSPMQKIIAPKVGKRLPKYLSEENMKALHEEIDMEQTFSSTRNRLIIDLFYNTGIRRSELIQLTEANTDTRNHSIKVLGKGNKERQIPIPKALSEQIERYRALKNEEFPTTEVNTLLLTDKGKTLYPRFVYNIVKRYIAKVSTIDQKSPHVLRHTFATHLINNGAELNAIKELLGHSNLSATQIYTHNSITRLKDIYKKAHPSSKGQ